MEGYSYRVRKMEENNRHPELIGRTFKVIDVANILGSRTKETCADRQVMKSIDMINRVLATSKNDDKLS